MPQEQIALITGGASGLGFEVVRQMAAADHEVIVTARDPARARDAVQELGPKVTALPVGLDIADQAGVDRAVAALTDLTGRLDVLINNAAAYVDWTETATSADLGAARRVLDTNLFGTWRLTQALLPMLRRSPAPRIVNVSSGAGSHEDTAFGLRARGGAAASYGISKAALNGLTSTLAAELADTPILVNAVCPGLTATAPGMEAGGARPAASAPGVVWAATLPAGGPTGEFFRDGRSLPW